MQNLRIYCCSTFLLLALCIADNTFAQTSKIDGTDFFLSLEDIPLMEGLEELPSETMSFDKPEGRIVESLVAMNGVSEDQVSQYYAQTLPAFGWGQSAKNKFFRKDEYLDLSFQTQDGKKYAKITIRPSL